MDNILEQLTAKPADWFGMKMAKNVTFNYVWLSFEDNGAVVDGQVELSKDGGNTWQKVDLTTEGSLIHGHVASEARYNAVRWINKSNRPVSFKILRFNVDVCSE